MEPSQPAARMTGLIWRRGVPIWRATAAAKRAGYSVKWVNLGYLKDDERALAARCQRLQAEMLAFVAGRGTRPPQRYDGTIGSLIAIYLTDPESPYRRLKHSSVHPYDVYARKLTETIGTLRIDACDGRDVRRWHAVWSAPLAENGRPRLAGARFAVAVLKAALSFGIQCRLAGCAEFKAILKEMRFVVQKPRGFAPDAAAIERARAAAHNLGQPAAALAYALQFETVLRQWDVIGAWLPLGDPRPSAVISGGKKWIGLTWSQIDPDMILRATPSKTEYRTGAREVFDLKLCPMVMAELAGMPVEGRSGPLIVDAKTGLPFKHQNFQRLWRSVAKTAGLSDELWNRDIRAGGNTEAQDSGTQAEDRAKVAGHVTSKTTTEIYDRGVLEAHRRVARSRLAHRAKTSSERGE
jgi:hypothetical protein